MILFNDVAVIRREQHSNASRFVAAFLVGGNTLSHRIHATATDLSNRKERQFHSQVSTAGIAEVVVLVDHNQSNHERTHGRHWFLQEDTFQQIETLVQRRALARWEGNYSHADLLRSQIDDIPLILCCSSSSNTTEHIVESMSSTTTDLNQYPVLLSPTTQQNISVSNYQFRVAIADIPRTQGGGSTWSLICGIPIAIPSSEDMNRKNQGLDFVTRGVLSWAHRALGIAVARAEHGLLRLPSANEDLMFAVEQAKAQLLDWKMIHEQLHHRPETSNLGTGMAMSLDKLFGLTSQNHSTSFFHWYSVETRLSGRTAADAAFWFAMAGVSDDLIFDLLLQVCRKELLRFGTRASCRAKDVMDIVERLAAAGIRDQPDMEEILQRCLAEKLSKKVLGKGYTVGSSASSVYLNLHAPHCALMIWNFSTRQRKQRSFLQTAANHYKDHAGDIPSPTEQEMIPIDDCVSVDPATMGLQWNSLFEDPTRPLVVDVGCGMGISLLGLASLEADPLSKGTRDQIGHSAFPWSECNFVGVDLSSLSIHYAQGIAQRWNIQGRLAFVVDEAERFLDQVSSYPGKIVRVLIQFPTPYRLPSRLDFDTDAECNGTSSDVAELQEARRGNTQLPSSVRNGGFMVSTSLLQNARRLLQRDIHVVSDIGCEPWSGDLLLQSNCEDVAIFMRNIACAEAGFVVQPEPMECEEFFEVHGFGSGMLQPTQRTLNWIALGGDRAEGEGWWQRPILPPTGRTETEVACLWHGTPVHRCILR